MVAPRLSSFLPYREILTLTFNHSYALEGLQFVPADPLFVPNNCRLSPRGGDCSLWRHSDRIDDVVAMLAPCFSVSVRAETYSFSLACWVSIKKRVLPSRSRQNLGACQIRQAPFHDLAIWLEAQLQAELQVARVQRGDSFAE